MFLTAYNLPHYLLSKGLITSESLVDGDFMLAEAGRRNRNFKIFRRKQSGIFVKQVKTPDAQATTTIHREAAFYRTVHSDPKYAAISHLIPKFYDYEPLRFVLTLSLTDSSESLMERQMREGVLPEAIAQLIGNALGVVHSHGPAMFADPVMRPLFPCQVAWPMNLDQTGDAFLNGFGTLGPQLASAMRQWPTLLPMLSALRPLWQYDSLIHGDMKWDNCLIAHLGGSEPKLTVVDWELADIGDGMWDVATIFKEYLVAAIMNASAQQMAAAQNAPVPVDQSIAAAQSSIRAFWKAYIQGRGWSGTPTVNHLERAVKFTAARMVIAVLEYLGISSQFNAMGSTMLQTAVNLLEEPQTAAAQMIGVPVA